MRRVDPKVHDHNRDLVLVGDEMVPDDGGYFGPGDLAVMSMEIDRQVSTAKKYPRNEASAEAKAKKMATESEDIALSCIYTLPRAGKLIPGPSVRLAEIVAYCWGNARYGSKIVEEEEEFIVAQGVYFDLERNVANTKVVRRQITDRDGRRYKTDMIQTAGAAAMSIALRNAILQGGIPSPIWTPVYDSAATIIGGAAKPLSVRRQMAIDRFAKMGVPAEAVLARLKVKELGDLEQEHIVVLRGLAQSIKDEVVTIEQAFPETRNGGRRQAPRTDVSEKLRQGREEGEARQKSTEDPPEPEDAAEPATEAQEGPADDAAPSELEKVEEAASKPATPAEAAKEPEPSDEDLPQEDMDVLDELRAVVSADMSQADRRRVEKDFAEAMGAMSPAGRARAAKIIGVDAKVAATRLL